MVQSIKPFKCTYALSPHHRPNYNGTPRGTSTGNNRPSPIHPSDRREYNIVPTNYITTKEDAILRTRINPTLTVDEVIRQLCVNLNVRDPHNTFSLRDEADKLVTNKNLKKKIKDKSNLKCVPTLEADQDRF